MKFKLTKKQTRKMARAFSLLVQLGLNMAVCMGLGFFIGMFIDNKLGTMPLFLIIFMIFGIMAAFTNMFRMLKDFF